MNDAYFDYRVRDLLHAVASRRARLIREQAIDDGGVRMATPRQWNAWRRRQVPESPQLPTFAGTIRSGVPVPLLRICEPARIVEVILPRAFGYRQRTRRLPQPVTPTEQRTNQDADEGVVEFKSRNVTEVTLVLDESSPYRSARIDPPQTQRPAGYDANKRLLGFTDTEGLGLKVPIELDDGLFAYQPSALLLVDEPPHPEDPLHLLVEAGTTEHDEQIDTVMQSLWLSAVNQSRCFGRWNYLRLEGDADARDRQLRLHLDALTREESPWDWIDYGR